MKKERVEKSKRQQMSTDVTKKEKVEKIKEVNTYFLGLFPFFFLVNLMMFSIDL